MINQQLPRVSGLILHRFAGPSTMLPKASLSTTHPIRRTTWTAGWVIRLDEVAQPNICCGVTSSITLEKMQLLVVGPCACGTQSRALLEGT